MQVSLTIELDPFEVSRLEAAARRGGMGPAEFARKVLAEHLPPLPLTDINDEATLALLREWECEDSARTPEAAQRDLELWKQFETNVNETRRSLEMRHL